MHKSYHVNLLTVTEQPSQPGTVLLHMESPFIVMTKEEFNELSGLRYSINWHEEVAEG